MRYGYFLWNNFDDTTKEAWNMRSTRLTVRVVPSLLLAIPEELNNNLIMQSINIEWQAMVNKMRECVVREPKGEELGHKRCFGKEKVVIGSQVFSIISSPNNIIWKEQQQVS